MRNDPTGRSARKDSSRVGRGATLADYAIFAMALTIIVAVLLGDRRGIANATKGVASTQADYLGLDQLIGVLMDEPAIPPLDATTRPKPRTATPAERNADDRR
jgi:hypothetical protein